MKLRVLPLAFAAVAAVALSCGDEDSTGTKDSTPPAAIADLTLTDVTAASVTLSWTAPGDDGTTGTAATYDIRYATATITDADWDDATAVSGEPTPQAAGTTQTMEITLPVPTSGTVDAASGAAVEVVYYFAIKTADEAESWSALSNVPSTESADLTAPAAITDLAITSVSATSATLSWTAPGDDGTTGTTTTYDIRYAASTITAGNWDLATSVTGEPAPTTAGTSQSMEVVVVVTGSAVTAGVSAGATYFFAIRTADEADNWSSLSNVPSSELADVTAPAAITDLAITAVTSSSMTLSWTAPGDDDMTGTASAYDIRYSTSEISDANWDLATSADGEPVPQAAGSAEGMEVTIVGLGAGVSYGAAGLSAGATYYVAIKTGDAADNWSALSNVVSDELGEPLTPAAVVDLACTDSVGESMTLTWTAPGNDGNTGTAAAYDLRYATDPITEATWDAATSVTGLPAPQAAGTAETLVFEDVTWWQTYHWALKTRSDTDDWSDISNIPRGTPVPPEGWRLLLWTGDGIMACDFTNSTTLFTDGNYPVETVDDHVFVGMWNSGIKEYDATGTLIATTPIPSDIWYSDFTPIPGNRFALTNNDRDSVYVIDADGDLLAADGLRDEPDQGMQMLDGVVVDNTLIICEDGVNNLLQMDCTTYALTLFKDLTALQGWLGTIDYYRGRYYLTQNQEIYSFTETGDPELIYEFPEGIFNLTGIAVAGGHAFVCLNSAGAMYRVNIRTGETVLVADGLRYPQDIALLRD